MEQGMLDKFLNLSIRSHSERKLLTLLPFELRLRIYELAGLFRKCPIDLNPPHLKYSDPDYKLSDCEDDEPGWSPEPGPRGYLDYSYDELNPPHFSLL
jgi:hypothetical protein